MSRAGRADSSRQPVLGSDAAESPTGLHSALGAVAGPLGPQPHRPASSPTAPLSIGSRLRVRPWQADAGIAHVSPAADHLGPLTPTDVEHAVERLRQQGYRAVITSALHRADRRPFTEAGFAETERLHLLRHDLDSLVPSPPPAGIELRRGRRREQEAALDVDRTAFTPFWRLDRAGLTEALTATSMVHFQVARDERGLVGYAVCGRAGHRGYVQRLAVAPRCQGRGVGAALLGDGLRWLRRWGARDALVNTQEDNRRSLRLYQRSGFVLQPDGLSVLELVLSHPATVTSGTATAARPEDRP
jgi:GNAT superfamily N-acetyltransferase